MSLLRKIRTLMGALVHKPFAARPEKVDLGQDGGLPKGKTTRQGRSELEKSESEIPDTGRVADLIARQKQEDVN